MTDHSKNRFANRVEQRGLDDAGEPDADERALFRQSVGSVEKIANPRRSPEQRRPSTRPQMRDADEQAVLDELLATPPPVDVETGDDLVYAREGVQHRVLRKLKRGQYRCQAELDLHGMTVDIAREAFAAFLVEARQADTSCVRIVHGKGHRSGHRGPVLKTAVASWLRQRDEVLAYASTPPHDGGTGAVYVLLRRR